MSAHRSLISLPWYDDKTDSIYLVVETPRGSRNKYAFDPETECFILKKVLPLGFSFPFDFGFIPSTLGEDGDPLDVLLLLDESVPMGCIVKVDIIGAIKLEQKRDGVTQRNDRLIATPTGMSNRNRMECLADLPPKLVEQIEAFFVAYARPDGKIVTPLGHGAREEAIELVRHGATRAQAARH